MTSALKDLPEALTMKEAAEVLRISLNSAYKAARENELPTVRIGRRLIVPKRSLVNLLEGSA